MDPDPDPGGPKTCGSCGSEFGSPTLVSSREIELSRSKEERESGWCMAVVGYGSDGFFSVLQLGIWVHSVPHRHRLGLPFSQKWRSGNRLNTRCAVHCTADIVWSCRLLWRMRGKAACLQSINRYNGNNSAQLNFTGPTGPFSLLWFEICTVEGTGWLCLPRTSCWKLISKVFSAKMIID